MLMPQEIEVWYVLPAIRKELAKAMSTKGMKQKQIAHLLDIAESAVSQYIKEKRAKEIEFDQDVKREIAKSADIIIKNKNQLMPELKKICELARKKRIVCRLHKKKGYSCECEVCLK